MPSIFDIAATALTHSAAKVVTPNDKKKDAYVLTQAQVRVLEAAGLTLDSATPRPTVEIVVVGENRRTVMASYYMSVRSATAARAPEPRMGRELISSWLQVGDELMLGTDGTKLFAARNPNSPLTEIAASMAEARVYTKLSDARIAALSSAPRGPAARIEVTTSRFIRSPVIAELARRRANGACEYPGCTQLLFETDDGLPFLEVHHITWLREGGTDSIDNAAALCPACHRAQHHSRDRKRLRAVLTEAIHVKLRSRNAGSS